MSQDVNLIVKCNYTECPYNFKGECSKDVLYVDDSKCIAQAESEIIV